jgi:hypothetical protein
MLGMNKGRIQYWTNKQRPSDYLTLTLVNQTARCEKVNSKVNSCFTKMRFLIQADLSTFDVCLRNTN